MPEEIPGLLERLAEGAGMSEGAGSLLRGGFRMIEELPGSPLHVLLGFLVAVTAFATLWSRRFRRGPLEWLLGKAIKAAELVR
ncbi:DUF418 domain-containing protein [Streptomyces xiangluensis]|uniref:DUF418 domain-containing protein n=1 Tax=Streptomyces xiangluensis TaxID=2665720 RepID=A0ABV8YKG9_9ACTN